MKMRKWGLALAFLLVLAGCSRQTGRMPAAEQSARIAGAGGLTTEEKGEPEDRMEKDFAVEEAAVLAAFERMQQAMIDKDIITMRSLVTEDKTFTHMSGKTQTKEEFFGEIEEGTLNYYRYEIRDPIVTVKGDTATLTANVTLTATVYGMSGAWDLQTRARFVKIDGKWLQCD